MYNRITVISILFIFLIPVCSAGKIYKWVDENGVTQFGTQPPPSQNSRELNNLNTRTSPADAGFEQSKLNGTWYTNRNGAKYSLMLGKHMYILSRVGEHNSRDRISGRVTMAGKKITIEYQRHEEKEKIGMVESFYVKSVSDTELVMVSDTTNRRTVYRKEGAIAASRNSVSGIAQQLVGKWKSSGQGDALELRSGKFIMTGLRKEKYINRIMTRRGTKYEGVWNVDDPFLYLEVHRDFVYKFEEIDDKSGSKLKYQIMENSGDRLELLDTKTRKRWTLFKVTR